MLIDKEIQHISEKIELLQDQQTLPGGAKSGYWKTFRIFALHAKGQGRKDILDAARDVDDRDCMTCRGLGRIGPIKCPCGHTIDVDRVHARRQPLPSCPWLQRSGLAVSSVLLTFTPGSPLPVRKG